MIRRPPRSTLFPTRRSSDLQGASVQDGEPCEEEDNSDDLDHDGNNDEGAGRSEEHTFELQSRRNLVCRLLLEIKKITTN